MIKNIAIVGGTHGNEVTGVHLCEQIVTEGYSFDVTKLLANPAAIEANKRYIERDLNRCFALADVNNSDLNGTENNLAKSINQQLGPKGKESCKTDFIVDLHTTTTEMGINIVIIQDDEFHLRLADFVQQKLPETVITYENLADHHFLCSISPRQILVEIGATPQGVLRHDIYKKSEQTLKAVLEFIELSNQDALPKASTELEIYEYFGVTYLPQDEDGNITGMIHENIQDRDFSVLKNGEPIFALFNGEEILYEGEDCVICFINEAAYYDEKKAFSMARKRVISL